MGVKTLSSLVASSAGIRVLFVFFCGAISQALLVTSAHAQDPEASPVHWAYSSYFGTGWYRIKDDRDVYVLRAAPHWMFREASLDESGERTIGVNFRLALAAGLDSLALDDIPGAIATDNLATLSVTPGVEVTVPMNTRWTLRPYASIGWGKLLSNSESAWTYWAGIKSRYGFSKGKLDWALINALGYVGYTPSEGSGEGFWPVMTGLDFDYPLSDHKSGEEQLFVSWHGTYTRFANDLNLDVVTGSSASITDQWELGLSFHKEKSPFKILWFGFERLGLAYRFSSSGDLKGVSLVFQSVFDR